MDNILLSGGLAFLITFFSIPVIIEVAKSKKLFDEPDERKVHHEVTPTLGGLGIFAGFIVASLLGVPSTVPPVFQYFVAAVMVIFFLGIKDDILILSAYKKFIGQLVAAGIIIKFGGVQINNMHGFLGLGTISHTASILLTLFTIIVITNSFNLIDGVDGLAGSLGLLTSTIFGLYFLATGQLMYAVMAFSLVGSLVAFLIYNFSPAKIFMGDTGSLLIGILNSVFVIKFIAVAADSSLGLPLQSAPAIGFAILIVPLFDTLRVVTMRILNRRSPFSPDRNHIHHFLLDLGLSHKMIALTCLGTNIAFIALAYFLRFTGTTMVILALSAVSFAIVSIIYYSRPKAKAKTLELPGHKQKETIIKSRKILSLAGETLEQN
jgi:UDP-GlcNAc:undecaprenyl-phosphate/decaprenyl-phosphate GlcNAc-1-phosphate transferase